MSSAASGLTIGERIAMARKVAGLNQHTLAQRANYSTSMVRAVEQGREPASPAFVAAIARGLGIETEELYGQPYRDLLDTEGGAASLVELRTLFAEGGHVAPLDPGSTHELAGELDRIRGMRHSDRAHEAIALTPVLLRQLHGALERAATPSDREYAQRLLAQTYANTAQMVYRFGWTTLAGQAVDRMDIAAASSDDPLLFPHAAQQRSLLLLAYASYETGEKLVQRSLGLLRTEHDSERVLALRGAAHLRGAIISARARDVERAREHIARAREIGQRVGHNSRAYDTNFGPGNVDIHDVAVSLEIGDPGRAARDGSALRLPDDVPANRVGHHWQDVARAWILAGDHRQALQALNHARRAAPQQTRYHPQVHETARAIVLAERRRSESIAHFTAWLGLRV